MVARSALSIWISPGLQLLPKGLPISSSLAAIWRLAEQSCESSKWMWKYRRTAMFPLPSCCWGVWTEAPIFLWFLFWIVFCIFRRIWFEHLLECLLQNVTKTGLINGEKLVRTLRFGVSAFWRNCIFRIASATLKLTTTKHLSKACAKFLKYSILCEA